MSNDPVGRAITNSLSGYWKDHPIQRDMVHGAYHAIRGVGWAVPGIFSESCRQKAAADFKRVDDHWFKGENRNDREHYNPSPGKSPGKK